VSRKDVLAALADRIVCIRLDHPLRVAIDGVDGAGKTMLADELAAPVAARHRAVIRASVDDFHNPRTHRYRLGKDSPEGYYRDSFDREAIETRLLRPLGPAGDRLIRCRAFDHRADAAVDPPVEEAAVDAILLFDGIFLQRPELREHFDLTIFLDVPFEVTIARMVVRDGADPNVEAASNRRWVGGQRLYLAECDPRARADVVVDNADWRAPRVLRDGRAS
jgi:uridine kinase